MRVSRWALAALVAAVALAGCSGGTSLTDSGAAPPEANASEEVLGEGFETDDAGLEESLAAFYDELLVAADRHRTPDELVAEDASGLAALAAPEVVADADAWRVANEAHGQSFERVVSLSSVANIAAIDIDGARAAISDCTATTRVMATGQEVTDYVSQVVSLANEGGRLQAVDLEVTHEGQIDSPGYGCVPDAMATQAMAAAQVVLDGFRGAQGDPRAGLSPEALVALADPLESELVSSLAEQLSQGASFASPVEVSLAAEGIDPRGLGEEVVVVLACLAYPEGLDQRDLASGKVVRQVFPPDTRQEVALAVRMNGAEGPEAFKIVSEAVPASC